MTITEYIDRIYKAKKAYYDDGRPIMNDCEYDRLEADFIKDYGRELFDEIYCVGYDHDKYLELKRRFV